MRDSSEVDTDIKELWTMWRSGKRDKYPSTLWVSVQEVQPPSSSQPTLRSMIATQPEQGQNISLAHYDHRANSMVSGHLPSKLNLVSNFQALRFL